MYSATSVFVIFLVLLVSPLFFKEKINDQVRLLINRNIQGNLDFEDVSLTFFDHFPSLTATLNGFDLKGSAPFDQETLISAKKLSLGIDISSLLSDRIIINRLYLDNAFINVQVDSSGVNNYDILKKTEVQHDEPIDSSQTNLAIKLIKISGSNLQYDDRSIPISITARGVDYEGKGDLSSAIFDLKTRADIDSFSLTFDHEMYVDKKTIHADLLTKINITTLAFLFDRNDLKINNLPIGFRGSFEFLSNGYTVDFKVRTNKSTLAEMLSVLPPAYNQWMADAKVKGNGEAFVSLTGNYIALDNVMPDLKFGLKLQDGWIAYKGAAVPVEKLNIALRMDLPHLDMDSLRIDLDTLSFSLAQGHFDAKTHMSGMDPLLVKGELDVDLNLENLHRALGIKDFDVKGVLKVDGKIDGKYATAIRRSGIRKVDTVITSIPTFAFKSSFREGYFKLSSLDKAVDLIEFEMDAVAKDSLLKHATFSLANVNIRALDNFIKGYAHLYDFEKMKVNANMQAMVDLGNIAQFYPLDSLDISGNLVIDLNASGMVDAKNNLFPKTNTHISLKQGYIRSWAYPIPIEDIAVEAVVKSEKGSMKDLKIEVLPISFKVADEPFFLRANITDLDNIQYDIKSKGKFRLEPFYKIFGIEGMNVNGFVTTNLSLAGLQSDAIKGYYQRLKNRGQLEIGEVVVAMDQFPFPFYVQNGKFLFNQEKIKFDRISGKYLDNELTVDGYISNYINYLVGQSGQLEGKFDFASNSLKLDDFMVFADASETSVSSGSGSQSSGVILIPGDLNVTLKAAISEIQFNAMRIDDFNGQLLIKDGQLLMDKTSFDLAGMHADMKGQYTPLSTNRAKFSYSIQADSFDIQRAYQEIPLFREMLTSAKSAHGQVSLDYTLAGLLNGEMSPVMSSLQGGGKLVLENISFKGFKLLNQISKETDKSSLNDASVSKVVINTNLKNNVMTIERTKMKVGLLRPRFEGQVTLDGQMNIGFRLGLPPFGILGIPLRITGTQEAPKIKLGKYSEDDLDMELDEEDKKLYEAEQAKDVE